jgi:hypothetical protein
MKLSPDHIAAIEAEVNSSMESVMILWIDPEAHTSAVVLPYEAVMGELVDAAFECGEAIDGVGKSVEEALVNLAKGLIQRNEERYPKLFTPPKGDPYG